MQDGRVVIKFDGDDSGLQRTVKNTSSSLGSLKSTIVKLGLGAVLTKTFAGAVSATNGFQTSLAKASTLFGDVAVDTDNLSSKLLELSSATGQSAEAITGSLYNALSAGVTVTEDMGDALSFMESATKLSVAGFTDMDTAVTATAKVINAYGMSMEDANRVGEILMQTQNLGITTVNELGASLAQVTPIAASFGVSFEQVGASMAVMTKQGTDTARASTQLRSMIAELGQSGTQASKNLQKAFKRAGLAYKNFSDFMKDPANTLQDAIRLLGKEAEISGVSLSDMFGSVEAGTGALQIANDETELYSTFLRNLEGDTHLVEDAYNKMMDTRTNKLAKMREQLKNIKISIVNSEAVQGILDSLTNVAQGFLNKVEEWLPTIKSTLNQFYFDARVIFAGLKHLYDESFLKDSIDFVINIAENALVPFAESFKNGDLFGMVVNGGKALLTFGLALTGLNAIKEGLIALCGSSVLGKAILGVGILTLTAYLNTDDAKKALQSIQDWFDGSFLSKAIKVSIEIVKNELEDFVTRLKDGDFLGAFAKIAGDLILFSVAFRLAGTGIETMKNAISTALVGATSKGGGLGCLALIGDALVVYSEFKLIGKEGGGSIWDNVSAFLLALGLGVLAGYFLGVAGGALVFGITFKLLRKWQDKQPDATSDEVLISKLSASPDAKVNLNTLEEQWEALHKKNDEMAKAVEDRIMEAWDGRPLREYYAELSMVINAVNGAYDDAVSQIEDIAKSDVGQRILEGIVGADLDFSAVGTWAEKYKDQIISALKTVFGIHSPSTVAKDEIGYWIGQGMIEGLWNEDSEQGINDFVNHMIASILKDVENGTLDISTALKLWPQIQQYTEDAKGRLAYNEDQRGRRGNGTIEDLTEPPQETHWYDTLIEKWGTIKQSFSGAWGEFKKGLEETTSLGAVWQSTFDGAFSIFTEGFSLLGESLAEGKASWAGFASAGLEAIASVLEALGTQLSVKAISALPNVGQMAIYSAGSALAFTGAGLVRGLANRFENGGIVGGSGYTGDKHAIYANAGELILTRAQQGAIASQLGSKQTPSISINFSGQVFGDEQSISEYVYNGIKTAQREGVIAEW